MAQRNGWLETLTSEKDENRISPGKSRAEELREDKRGVRWREQESKKREKERTLDHRAHTCSA